MQSFPLIDQVPEVLKPYILDFLWDMEKLHQLELPTEMVQIADLQHPIIARDQNDRLVIMDGVHRLLKAAMLGNDQIKVDFFGEQHIPLVTN